MIKSHVALSIGAGQCKSARCLVLASITAGSNIMYLLCHVTSHNHGWELFAVCQHPDKSSEHKNGDSGYIIFLICHATYRDYIFKGMCEFMSGIPSW